ncbi:MAG: transglutaminase domain-containing protein [Clostridiales bacterium]|nr:transglutaminase domain-containing protein [Clostridiales bacterium]
MYSDLKYLAVPLPEDVLKLKGYGDLERLNRVIDKKLAKDNLPLALRRRLEYEKIIISLWPRAYPHNQEAAMKQLRDCFGDFTEEELDQLRDDDAVEWAYINGEIHYKNNFLSNLIKTRPHYAARVVDENRLAYSRNKAKLLNENMARMKKDGKVAVRFHMRAEMTIDPLPGRDGQKVYAHLPLPIEYAQVKNFKLLSVSHPDAIVAPSDFPQRTICFHEVPDRPFVVEYTYENHLQYVEPDPAKVIDQQPTFYTEEYAPHISFTPYLKMLAAEIVGDEKNPLIKARKIYDFITTKMIYSFMRAYMTMPNVPEYGASSMKGDCGVQALLFITLCRICGIPARWQAGLDVNPLDVGEHDWAQFYIAPYGWLFADPSYGGGAYRAGDMERWNFYFGNLDPYRMPANSEYQHDFYVPYKNHRYDPYDNQDGEAEYEDASVPGPAWHSDQEALSIEIIEE